MDITELLEEAKQKQRQLVDQINMLKQQEQQLLQEALKIEGEIRVLLRLEQKENDVIKQKQGEKTDA